MLWIFSIFLFLPGSVLPRPRCGGVYTAARGVIHTPNFPQKFPIPIHCEWIIDAQHFHSENSSIIVYMTQLFIFEGLTFSEYQIYDQTYQLNGRQIHAVTENNVTKVAHLESKQDYLVITLKLESIESTHLRVLDHLLDVFGFNITYEITSNGPRRDRCTMMDCGFTGTCYDHYNRFSCSCFPGYEGPKCSEGPNSLCTVNTCKNGGTCVHVGDTATRCECREGYAGERCDRPSTAPTSPRDCSKCFVSCAFDGREENACKCPEGSNSTFSDNYMDYVVNLKLVNLPYQKQAQQRIYAENQISRSVRDLIPTLEDCHISQFESYPGHVEVTFRMSGLKKDERRLKSATGKWSDRGHIGNLTLMPGQPVTVHSQQPPAPQSLSIQPSGLIHAGEDFVLSCASLAQTQAPAFRWFKDGVFINVTSPTSEKWSKVAEEQNTRDRYVGTLGLNRASPFDQGTFTCQIVEGGYQRCLSRRVNVRAPPRVWIEPMSLTVRKGENFTIKCFSVSGNEQDREGTGKYTYSWTKNRELLPIKTDTEHYEVLFPMGSILQVSSINKSTSFSCLVQDSAVWSEQSILVNVIDSELVKTCSGERHLRLLWPETAPGTESLQECPSGYHGVARRACALRDTGQPTWYLPDFAGCIVDELQELDHEFQKLRLGYASRRPVAILKDLRRYLQRDGVALLPGEGSRVLVSVRDVVDYMNDATSRQADDASNTVLDIVDRILRQRYSVVNQTQVILLQQVVKGQSPSFGGSSYHRAFSSLDVTLAPAEKTGFHVPLPTQRYPSWFSYKLHLALPSQQQSNFANKSAALFVVVYKNLSAFLPQRAAIRLKDGSEMDYEIISNVASTSLVIEGRDAGGNLSDGLFTMEFTHPPKNASFDLWKILCGIADYASYGYSWNTQTCITRLLESTKTRCLCPRAGTYAVLLTMKPSSVEVETIPVKNIMLLVGCFACASLTIITGSVLAIYWYFRRSCLVFLKIQCCLSTFGSMVVFMYALWDEVDSNLFLMVMSLLESFLLTGMSSQLSNLLIVYSELVQLPRMKNIKETVVLIITGAPMIAVFGNHMAHLTMNTRINSWWLLRGSLSFNIFTGCATTIVVLYFVLFYIVTNKIHRINVKYEKSSEPLKLRLKLLKRSALIFSSITILILTSVTYINYADNTLHHYIFSGVSVTVGGVIFFCYVLYSETSIKQLLIARLKDGSNEKPSPNDAGKHLKFSVFTKQKPDVENDSAAPYFVKNGAETRFSEMGATTFKTYSSASFEAHAHSSHSQSELQLYEESPKGGGKQQQQQRECVNSPDLLGTKKFVELDLVASSCRWPPKIMVTQVEEEERQRPDGGEEIVPIVSVQEGAYLAKKGFGMCVSEPLNISTIKLSDVTSDNSTTSFSASDKSTSSYNPSEKSASNYSQSDKSTGIYNPNEKTSTTNYASNDKNTITFNPVDKNSAVSSEPNGNLDAVLDSITHDLDYLLNGNEFDDGEADTSTAQTPSAAASACPVRRISRPPSLSVFEQIAEEPDEEEVVKVPEAITNVSRTSC